jgi:O-antigen/teichoic acid export membrane protein
MCLGVALGGEITVRVIAERSYWSGASVIPLVAFAYFLNGFQYCVAPGIHLGGKTHLLPLITLTGAASNIVLNLLWIPSMGMMGAAMATVVSFALVSTLVALLSRRAYGFKFGAKGLWTPPLILGGLFFIGLGTRTDSFMILVLSRAAILLIAGAWVGSWCMRDVGLRWAPRRRLGQGWFRFVRSDSD